MADKRKVLIIVHSMSLGGIQRSLVEALDIIDYDKYELELFVLQNKTELVKSCPSRVKLRVCEDRRKYYRMPRFFILDILIKLFEGVGAKNTAKRLYNYTRDRIWLAKQKYAYKKYFSNACRYDIAVSYAPEYTAQFTDRYIRADKKIVFFHSSIDENERLHKKVFPHFNKIIAVNERCERTLCGLYPSLGRRISSIPNYISPERIRKGAEENRVELDKDALNICTCGRMSYEKGFDLACECAKLLDECGIAFKWYFIGDGVERGRLETFIEKNELGEKIVLTGFLPQPYGYMNGCDIYVQPSRNESFGLSLLEAMILCKPTLSTRTDGGERLIRDGENGILCDKTPQALADGIKRLYEDKDLRSRIVHELKKADYAKDKIKYASAWDKLLSI